MESPRGDLDKCPICLVAYLNEQNKAETACGHGFCRACILDVLKTSHRQGFTNCPYCRQKVSIFDIVCGGRKLAEHPNTIYGSIYVQGNKEGLASYHFEEEESYISYSAAPPYWRLDDGTPPPEKKSFEETSYDPDTRTFKAVVNWSPVAFHKDSRWEYRIVFSEDFLTTEGGEVTAYQSEGQEGDVHIYGQHLVYKRVFDMEQLIAQLQ